MTTITTTTLSFNPKNDADELREFERTMTDGWIRIDSVSGDVIYRKTEILIGRKEITFHDL